MLIFLLLNYQYLRVHVAIMAIHYLLLFTGQALAHNKPPSTPIPAVQNGSAKYGAFGVDPSSPSYPPSITLLDPLTGENKSTVQIKLPDLNQSGEWSIGFPRSGPAIDRDHHKFYTSLQFATRDVSGPVAAQIKYTGPYLVAIDYTGFIHSELLANLSEFFHSSSAPVEQFIGFDSHPNLGVIVAGQQWSDPSQRNTTLVAVVIAPDSGKVPG
jgi:hypothetical protein